MRRQIASGARPIPPPTRIAPAASGLSSPGIENGRPERAGEQQSVAGLEGGQGVGARPDVLEQEGEPDAVVAGVRLGDREGARQERPLAAPSPPRLAGEHVELPRVGHRPRGVADGDDPVAAADLRGDDVAAAPAERRQGPGSGSVAASGLIAASGALRERLSGIVEVLQGVHLGHSLALLGADRPGGR